MMKRENHDLFSSEEFEFWASVKDLKHEEALFFERYLYPLSKDAHVLDVGAGAGRFLFALRQRGFRHLTGVDLSPRMVEAARDRCRQLGAEDFMEFRVANASALPFEDGSQDAVMALQQLLSLVEEPDARKSAIKEFQRVLAPQGILVATFLSWEGRWFNPLLATAMAPVKIFKGDWQRLKRNYLCWLKTGQKLNAAYLTQQQPYTYWFEKDEIEELLAAGGFEILELTTDKMLVENRQSFSFGGTVFVAARKRRG